MTGWDDNINGSAGYVCSLRGTVGVVGISEKITLFPEAYEQTV